MKAIIVINDSINKYEEYQATGVLNQPSRRCVEIELPCNFSISKGEQIESISIKMEQLNKDIH